MWFIPLQRCRYDLLTDPINNIFMNSFSTFKAAYVLPKKGFWWGNWVYGRKLLLSWKALVMIWDDEPQHWILSQLSRLPPEPLIGKRNKMMMDGVIRVFGWCKFKQMWLEILLTEYMLIFAASSNLQEGPHWNSGTYCMRGSQTASFQFWVYVVSWGNGSSPCYLRIYIK